MALWEEQFLSHCHYSTEVIPKEKSECSEFQVVTVDSPSTSKLDQALLPKERLRSKQHANSAPRPRQFTFKHTQVSQGSCGGTEEHH